MLATLYRRPWLLVKLPIAIALGIVAAFVWVQLHPMPPSQLLIATGAADGAYHLHATRYVERFAANGVRLHLQTSAGSAENLTRLQAAEGAADLAFVQGGFGYLGTVSARSVPSRIQTLANVDTEPLWIFSLKHEIESLDQLTGLRVAIGPEGSGSRTVALRLFEQARINLGSVQLSSFGGIQAANALRKDEIDVALMVAATDASSVQLLLGLRGIRLASLRRSAAITERNPFLETRLLAQGALEANIPPRDIGLLTTSASLVAREDLHPALKRLTILVAAQTHGGNGLFHRAGDFPALRQVDFPSAPDARATLQHGPNALERLLPFWWAQIVERLLVIVLPASLVALWLMRIVPAALRWSLQSRVNRWYGELKFIENDLASTSPTGPDVSRLVARLNAIDQSVMAFAAPRELMARCFTLHHHIEFVRLCLHDMRGR